MRLAEHEIDAIITCVLRHFGEGAVVRLFGSRTDDAAAGGDIDLHIVAESADKAALSVELQFIVDLKDRIGEQRIDVIVRPPGYKPRALDRIAIETGIVLEW